MFSGPVLQKVFRFQTFFRNQITTRKLCSHFNMKKKNLKQLESYYVLYESYCHREVLF